MTAEDFPLPTGGCAECGCALDYFDRHLQFKLPDAVLSLDKAELQRRTYGHDELMHVKGYGWFVRCLLRITMTEDNTVTFGVWLAVHPDEFCRVAEIWDEPEYAELEILGALANAVPPWGPRLLGASARAVVRDPEELPHVVEGFTPLLDRVVTGVWPYQHILTGLPH